MRGFWMGYAAQRAAPLGAASAAIATAAFFGFHPDRIARALPDAWAPDDARGRACRPARPVRMRRCGGCGVTHAAAAPKRSRPRTSPGRPQRAPIARAACWRAANQALPRPAQPHLALWQAATTLREHRGDGHIAVLVARGVTPLRRT